VIGRMPILRRRRKWSKRRDSRLMTGSDGVTDVAVADDVRQIRLCPRAVGAGRPVTPSCRSSTAVAALSTISSPRRIGIGDHSSFASQHVGAKPFETIEVALWAADAVADHCVQGTHGAEFHRDLDVTRAQLILRKGYRREIDPISAMFENDKRPHRPRRLFCASEPFPAVLTGLATDYCVAFSAIRCRRAGVLRPLVVLDGCRRSISPPARRGRPASHARRRREVLERNGLRLRPSRGTLPRRLGQDPRQARREGWRASAGLFAVHQPGLVVQQPGASSTNSRSSPLEPRRQSLTRAWEPFTSRIGFDIVLSWPCAASIRSQLPIRARTTARSGSAGLCARRSEGFTSSTLSAPNSRAASTLPSTSGGEHGLPPWHQPQLVIMGGFDQAIPEKIPVEKAVAQVDAKRLVRPTRLEPLCPCSSHSVGKPGVAASLRGIRAFSQRGLDQKIVRPRVLVRLFECRRFGLGIALLLVSGHLAGLNGLSALKPIAFSASLLQARGGEPIGGSAACVSQRTLHDSSFAPAIRAQASAVRSGK